MCFRNTITHFIDTNYRQKTCSYGQFRSLHCVRRTVLGMRVTTMIYRVFGLSCCQNLVGKQQRGFSYQSELLSNFRCSHVRVPQNTAAYLLRAQEIAFPILSQLLFICLSYNYLGPNKCTWCHILQTVQFIAWILLSYFCAFFLL